MNVDDPQWYRRAIFYEVLVRGFNDSSDEGTGGLRGDTENDPNEPTQGRHAWNLRCDRGAC